MINPSIINKYIAKDFLKTIVNTSLIFFCLTIILNLFEEINYFKDLDVKIYLPILLSSLIVPGLLYNMLPFIVLIAGIWFFLKIKIVLITTLQNSLERYLFITKDLIIIFKINFHI